MVLSTAVVGVLALMDILRSDKKPEVDDEALLAIASAPRRLGSMSGGSLGGRLGSLGASSRSEN